MIRKFLICTLMIIGLSASFGLLNTQSQAPTPSVNGAIPAQTQTQSLRLTVLYDNIVSGDFIKGGVGRVMVIE